MTIRSVPLNSRPTPHDDDAPTELHLAAVRTQAAIVWAIADALGREGERTEAGLRAQLAEELARLGCLAIEAAAVLSVECEAGAESGVHVLQ